MDGGEVDESRRTVFTSTGSKRRRTEAECFAEPSGAIVNACPTPLQEIPLPSLRLVGFTFEPAALPWR
jgi:hypothetical protein